MRTNKACFSDGSRGALIFTLSTSSYFGGTGVAAYVASKHATLGLFRASQSKAAEVGVRQSAVAPFVTPTHITAGFADAWKDAGLPVNTTEGIARALVYMAVNPQAHGKCCLVSGAIH